MVFKLDWERGTPHANLSKAEIVKLIRGQIPDVEVIEADILSNGCINSNYRIGTTDGDLLLRLNMRKPSLSKLEYLLAQKLHGTLPVPEIYYYGETANFG